MGKYFLMGNYFYSKICALRRKVLMSCLGSNSTFNSSTETTHSLTDFSLLVYAGLEVAKFQNQRSVSPPMDYVTPVCLNERQRRRSVCS